MAALKDSAQEVEPQLKNFRIKLVNYNTGRRDPVISLSVLRSFLSKHGYIIDEFGFGLDRDSRLANLVLSKLSGTKYFSAKSQKYYEGEDTPYSIHSSEWLFDLLITKKIPFAQKAFAKLIADMHLEDVDLLGFSVHGKRQIFVYLALAMFIKQKYDIPIVMGGPYIKQFHNFIDLKKFNWIDYLVTSDGEMALLGLARYLDGSDPDIKGIPSIKYMQNGEVISNEIIKLPFGGFMQNQIDVQRLNKIKENIGSYSHGIPYEISHGCPYTCAFCTWRSTHPYERKDIDTVMAELKELTKLTGHSKFRFWDPTFNVNPRFVERFCNAIIEQGLHIQWSALVIANLQFDLLKKMKEAGCWSLSTGIDTGSKKIHGLMGKPAPFEYAAEHLSNIRRAGIHNQVYILVGFPHENKEEFKETLDFVLQNKASMDSVYASRFQLEYGSILYNNPQKFSITIRENKSKYLLEDLKFDEIDGLKWEDKANQTTRHFEMLMRELRAHDISHLGIR